ncbi:MAG: tRNA1(Val) (adenine(37)-N6)-methyltransferase [Acholeplasmataceae bacterium]|jgi:tRNA1(Val) A37 N6-methylase TrmN6|nr:tRNA1(Val) (adenine(37)-N6)-methyltransferase [Acholeplasmataceae bacterium]
MRIKHQLFGYPKYVIYQKTKTFHFSLDSMLLADFVKVKKGVKNIIDLGTGNAVIPMFLTLKTDAQIYGVEIQKEPFELGLKSIKENRLTEQIKLYHDDIKNTPEIFSSINFETVICNPPYFKYYESSNLNQSEHLTIARHEVKITLEEIVEISYKLLKNGGSLFLIHRPERLADVFAILKEHKFEPKQIRFVYPKHNKKANHVLIHATKGGRPSFLNVLKPLFVYQDNKWTAEVLKIYNYGRKEDASE